MIRQTPENEAWLSLCNFLDTSLSHYFAFPSNDNDKTIASLVFIIDFALFCFSNKAGAIGLNVCVLPAAPDLYDEA